MPWEELCAEYCKALSVGKGAGAKDARVVLGAVMIKHICSVSDEETIRQIQENPYLQFFVGLSSFSNKRIFHPTLFVTIRKRLGEESWKKLIDIFIVHIETIDAAESQASASETASNEKEASAPTVSIEEVSEVVSAGVARQSEPKQKANCGTLIIDATVAPQDIRYPTDIDLLNTAREKIEEIITVVCQAKQRAVPRMYRRKARRDYLLLAKKKKRTRKDIRKAIGKQLRYLKRDLKHFESIVGDASTAVTVLNNRQNKEVEVIGELYKQQLQMYTDQVHKCQDRIVSIHQPHVRPIVRGKAKADVEFGAKIGVSMHNGFARIETVSWSNYDEGKDLIKTAEHHKKQYSCYPEKIIADRKYITRENRAWCAMHGIYLSGKPLGRPGPLNKEKLKQLKADTAQRQRIEGKFGTGKNHYGLDRIHARLPQTSTSWLGAIFFALNVVRLPEISTRLFDLLRSLNVKLGMFLRNDIYPFQVQHSFLYFNRFLATPT